MVVCIAHAQYSKLRYWKSAKRKERTSPPWTAHGENVMATKDRFTLPVLAAFVFVGLYITPADRRTSNYRKSEEILQEKSYET